MKLKKTSAVLAGLASVTLLAACSKQNDSQNKTKQVLNWTESTAIATQDPSLATDTTSFNTLLNTQEGLYRLDKKQNPKPALAVKTKISQGGKVYDFTLRKNAKWSNGQPVTAKDFVYAHRRTVNPKTKASMAFYLYQIKNAKEINLGQKAVNTLGVKAISKYHLQITLTRPVSYFKRLLAFPLFFPQNKQAVAKYGDKYGTQAKYLVFNGPYRLTKWTGSNKKWTLVKNKTYWDQKKVHLTKINELVTESTTTSYNLYQAKETDETLLTGSQVKANQQNAAYHQRKASALSRLELNQNKVKAFTNLKIRRAISLAINRNSLTNNILQDGSTPAKGFVPSGMGYNPKTKQAFQDEAYDKSAVSYNLKKAKQLWQEGLKEEGISSLTVTLSASDTDSAKKVAAFLQSSLAKLPGLNVEVQTIPYTQLITKQGKKDYEMTLKNWQAILADPINFLDIFEKDSSYNNSGYNDNEFDRLLDEAENKYGNQPQKRWERLVAAEKVLMATQGTIPLYQVAKPQLLRTSVKNVLYNPTGCPYDFKTASISK
ncbi:peptide/nickel transport system substrate-binding protein/oligopeptide transport system substrate-binding protein [Ligilactobacillus sp. WC1T17]|uniref:Peptide/nickel transport system substrate-binding protein/oligopeptide transport system substrate-binding protein n=1 Tax=Ligilactobacillus ruminis TaxID=1623 RepID=A0ABY1AD85_9LACO|nr:peptide/nickel transport system substrate-binding protein/oligopeptide transport system substrate-binding protein [Ligilactobacillus ruminis]